MAQELKPIKILDCTFRDGGYYGEWNFSSEVVSEYLHAISLSNIDAIELGLRSTQTSKFFGPFAYCTDEFLRTLPLPAKTIIGVMIDAKEYLKGEVANVELLDKMFAPSAESPVKLVRIACHIHEIFHVGPLIKQLTQKGYRIGINIMQSTGKTEEQIAQAVKKIGTYEKVEILYFADSLGNMLPPEARQTINVIKKHWSGPIGFHAHDNTGNAMGNALALMEEGVTWIDSTVLGMGRGAGNLKSEYILFELYRRGYTNYYPEPLFPLAWGSFRKLQEQYNWGSNLMYYLSASYGVHPTFVQDLLNNPELQDAHKLLDAINKLKGLNATSYNVETLSRATKVSHIDSDGTWNPSSAFEDRDVLILGSGPSVKRHLEGIKQFIKRNNPVVIALNIDSQLPHDLISAYAACHPMRILLDSQKYENLKRPIMIPLNSLAKEVSDRLGSVKVWNYGLKITDNTFDFRSTSCTAPVPLVFAYALGAITAGRAKTAFLAGFDGYGKADPKQLEMEQVLDAFSKASKSPQLIAITPTSYKIKQSTVYAPKIN